MSGTWTPTKPVSADEARAVWEVVVTHFRGWTHDQNGQRLPAEELPVLREPGTGWGRHWVITWEGTRDGTPYQWPVLATIGGVEEFRRTPTGPAPFPAGVNCEAANPCELEIYPA